MSPRPPGSPSATVSRALRGLDRVSPATRAKVLKVASDDGLRRVADRDVPRLRADPRRGRRRAVPHRWFFATLVSAIEKTLRPHGHHVSLFDLEEDTYDQRAPADPEHAVEAGRRRHHPQHPDDPTRWASSTASTFPSSRWALPSRAARASGSTMRPRCGSPRSTSSGSATNGSPTSARSRQHRPIETPRARLAAFRRTMRAHDLVVRDEWVLSSDWTADVSSRHR